MPEIPSHGLTTLPLPKICCTTRFTALIGIANPTPCAKGIMAVFIPITCPLMSASGPPELPGLIAASVWINPSKMNSAQGIGRPNAPITPSEAVDPPGSPRVLPIASANCPTFSESESPRVAAGRFETLRALIRAMSVAGSVPATSPSKLRPSLRWIWTLEAPSMTWLFVTIYPFESIITPEPCPSIGTTPFLEFLASLMLSIATTLSFSLSTDATR